MVSVLAASAERRGERVKGRNGVAEGGWCARSRPTVPHDSAAAREEATTSMEGLGPAYVRSHRGNEVFREIWERGSRTSVGIRAFRAV